MSYTAMKKCGAFIPGESAPRSNMGRESISFIRDCCENLMFDEQRSALQDETGVDGVPYNFERDVDRLCLEKAIYRFLKTGAREDAFDIYFCYSEIFRPFGSGYEATKTLLEMLSEHEENSSSLLMKHRDHYSHSVYVFLLGLAIYKNSAEVRKAYCDRYRLLEGPEACNHFLKYWGMASLFHDIGYPFEIAHQQMKAYVCQLTKIAGKDVGSVKEYAPFISYKRMDAFVQVKGIEADMNRIYAAEITKRIGKIYGISEEELYLILKDRAVNEEELEKDREGHIRIDSKGEAVRKYLYMDHAYFSGLILLKKYFEVNAAAKEIPEELMDTFIAIILHNSLFKFGIRGKQRGLNLADQQPLSYLLMLCDELQCWDRTSYGQNSRNEIYPFDFDIRFEDSSMTWIYYYDQAYAKKTARSKVYQNMMRGYRKKDGSVKNGYKFVDDIDEIVQLSKKDGICLDTVIVPKKKRSGEFMSDTNYLNIYDFALALNGRYSSLISAEDEKWNYDEIQEQLQEAFQKLSLEFKLSNIAQAKYFAKHLEKIHCFYSDRPVDYEMVVEFTDDELVKISELEHMRWCEEKAEMGWSYGIDYENEGYTKQQERKARALSRRHKDMVDFSELTREEVLKDSEPMRLMIKLLKVFDGLSIYRVSENRS